MAVGALIAAALAASAPGATELRAGDVPGYAELETGETVTYVLRSGRAVPVRLVKFDRTSAVLVVAGDEVEISYRPFAGPVTVKGVRVAVEITRAWSDRKRWRSFGLAEDKDCRLFLSDASGPVMSGPAGVYPLRPAPVLNSGRSGGWLSGRRSSQKDCHIGYDTYGPMGTAVVAVEAGGVLRTGLDPYRPSGRSVAVASNRFTYSYIHLATVEVKPGQEVAAGERLGMMGQSGWVRPHLHIQMSPAGTRRQVNPQHYLRDMYRRLEKKPAGAFHRVNVRYVDAAGEPVQYSELWLKFADGTTLPCDRTASTAVRPGPVRLIATQKKLGLRGEAKMNVRSETSVTITMSPAEEDLLDPASGPAPEGGDR